jgi:hypothetical protein
LLRNIKPGDKVRVGLDSWNHHRQQNLG